MILQKEISHPLSLAKRSPQPASAKNPCFAGIVAGVSGLYYETPDFDAYRFAAQLILFFIFLPFLIALFSVLLGISIALGIFRLSPLSLFVNMFNLLLTFKLFNVIFPFHFGRGRSREVPKYTIRLMGNGGKEADVVIKGFIHGAYPQEGDMVEVEGKWKDGILQFERGLNHNTGVVFELRRSPWRVIFFTLLLLLIGAGTWISLSVPLRGY